MKSQQQPNAYDQEKKDCNRVKIKKGRGKEWEVEVSTKSNYVVLTLWLSTLLAGFIVLYLVLNYF